jgi:hypothetical protein
MDLASYVPQLITALATLVGVLLTLIFTGRRDKKRLDLEERKFELEVNAKQSIRFEEIKREAFSDALYHAEAVRAFKTMGEGPISWIALFFTPNAVKSEYALAKRIYEIELIAPELHSSMQNLRQHLQDYRHNSSKEQWRKEYHRLQKAALREMRASLAIDNDTLKPHVQERTTEAGPIEVNAPTNRHLPS